MNTINKEEAIKIYMAKTKEELAEMLWKCYENSLPQAIKTITEISYSFNDIDDVMCDIDTDKYIQIFNDLMNISEVEAALYPDAPIKCICESFEDMCNHYLMKDIDKLQLIELFKEGNINTSDEYFLIEKIDGNISIKSGDLDYLINHEEYIKNVYNACFCNKNIYNYDDILHIMQDNIDKVKNYLIEEYKKYREMIK